MPLTFDLLTLELVRNVTRWTDNHSANFDASATSLCRVMDKYASKGRCDVITLTFDLGGHRVSRWCGSSYSIREPRLKFVGLPVPKTWCIFRLSVNRPIETLTFDLLTSKWSHGLPVSWASLLPIFSLLCPSVLDIESSTRETDRQTDRQTTVINA